MKAKIHLICLLFFTFLIFADERLESLFNHKDYQSSIWSCSVLDLSTKKMILEHKQNRAMIPASNQKIYLYAAFQASKLESPKTEIFIDGDVKNNTLFGNLIIKGNGAICIGNRFPYFDVNKQINIDDRQKGLEASLRSLSHKLEQNDIKRIEGDLILDKGNWGFWVNEHYPTASPFMINENTIDIEVKNGKVFTSHKTPFDLKAVTGDFSQRKKNDQILINPSRDSIDYWRLNESMILDHYKNTLKNYLVSNGVRFGNKKHKGKVKRIDYFISDSVLGYMKGIGTHSDNLRAELIFLYFADNAQLKVNYKNAQREMMKALAPYKLKAYNAADGSGLSRDNKVTTHETVTLLTDLYIKDKDMILHWLAKPGEAGTLKNKCLDYKGRLWAKTGTLKDVKALSGYIKTISGKTYAFSILCNNGPGSERCWQTIEDILKILDKY